MSLWIPKAPGKDFNYSYRKFLFVLIQIITGSLFLILSILISGCGKKNNHLFELLKPRQTGIRFNNQVVESEELSILTLEYKLQIYNGAGVGLGDFNNDGLEDIFFSGNLVENKLYLNQGKMKFREVGREAGVSVAGRWCTGVSIVDINGDGLTDIYVGGIQISNFQEKPNLLFINQGLDKKGIPTFKDESSKSGITETGQTTSAAFFDYDRDNDLDLYILINQMDVIFPNSYRVKQNDGSSPGNDQLYRNNGNGTFTRVTLDAGIVHEGYGLGVSVVDFNNDNWPDLYITNDYLTNDVLYINNQNGTFTNEIRKYLKHTSHSAMGHDISDINNDGLPDIYALDMLPEYNQRQKRMLPESKYSNYINNEKLGYEYQYVRNMLQLNNGADRYGNHNFSEIGLMTDLFATDWSWSCLLADFDNDGNRDIYVTNGFPKDLTDLDYGMSRRELSLAFNKDKILSLIPEVKVTNYAFQNNGNFVFTNKTKDWGFEIPSFSYSVAYGDLDNDGDLDLVVSNMNQEAFIYRNTLYDAPGERHTHFLRIKLTGPKYNDGGFGSKVKIYYDQGKLQYQDHSPYRGYESSVEPYIHFGLGNIQKIDSLIVTWTDGKIQKLTNINADQTIRLFYPDAIVPGIGITQTSPDPGSDYPLIQASKKYGIYFKHKEDVFIDFIIQPLLPHQFSQSGPSLAAGDINGDGKDDFFIGGSLNRPGTIYFQTTNTFMPEIFNTELNNKQEDLGTLLFDADNDGDLDLYIVSGSYEQELKPEAYMDRIYVNNGKGKFSIYRDALPEMIVSGSCVKGADFDQDGDIDLFVGGRVFPGYYPKPVSSYLLRNDSEKGKIKFTDVTGELCPVMKNLGMVTDALWSDFDNDGWMDLVITGEWMPIRFLKNGAGILRDITGSAGLENYPGWWNSLSAGDFDADGDMDYIAGNLGLNSFYKATLQEPMKIYSGDFDHSGNFNFLIFEYLPDSLGMRRLYPVHSLLDIVKKMPFLKKRFPRFYNYSVASFDELLTEKERSQAQVDSATWMQSIYIENLGGGRFQLKSLPMEAQFAPVYGTLPIDLDQDGNLDVLLTGNTFDMNVFWGRNDAMNGLWLKGDGKGKFIPLNYPKSGFLVPGDAKAIIQLQAGNDDHIILVSQNQDSLKVFIERNHPQTIALGPDDAWADVINSDGKHQRFEFYYGNSYLSQSARKFDIPVGCKSIVFHSFTGKIRKVIPRRDVDKRF